MCGDFVPSCSEYNTFVKVSHSDRDEETINTLVNAFLFEISSTLGLDYSRSRFPEQWDDYDDDKESRLNEMQGDSGIQIRPILHGAGIRDLLGLYMEAAT